MSRVGMRIASHRHLILAAGALLAGTSRLGLAQPAPAHPAPALTGFARTIDSLVPAALEELLVPGAAVALIENDRVVFMRGYGVADRASRAPVTEHTVFNVGSMSKSVTAWGVMRLVHEGTLDLDRGVDAYLSRWHLPDTDHDEAGVTVRRLLSHTAGLSRPSVTPYAQGQSRPTIEKALAGRVDGSDGVRVVVPPGTEFRYSGGGYDVLQLLIEERTHRRFADYMRDAVLHPLGMTHSAFAWTPAISSAAATSYDNFGQPLIAERFTEVAAAGLQTTVADMARFAIAELAGSGRPRAMRPIMPPEMIRLMQSPVPPAPAWGLGHEVLRDSASGIDFVGHNGANTGWRAIYQVAPARGQAVVVLTNGSNGFSLLQWVACAWERSVSPGARTRYCDPPGVRSALYAPYAAGGVERLIAHYETLKQNATEQYAFDAGQLVGVGYDLLRAGHGDDAVRVFEENVRQYPDDWNAHDSLAESYLVRADTVRAREHYLRSVELNPNNTNGAGVLARIGRSR